MLSASKLIIFTYSYPHGLGEEWKYNEFGILSNYFEHVTIQPYTYGSGKEMQRNLPPNFSLNEPLISVPLNTLNLLIKGVFNLAPVKFAFIDLIERSLLMHPKHLKFWLNSTLLTRYLASNSFIQKLSKSKRPDTILYFYWGTGPALIIPLLKSKNFFKVIAKFHGGDLYEERNKGYLPFRNSIFKTLTHALFISEQGLRYAIDKYNIKHGNVSRLGVISQGLANYSQDNILRIVTCSSVIPVKRLSLLVDALHHVQCPINWTHIGSGPLLISLRKAASMLPGNVRVKFLGFVPAQKVQFLYTANNVDLFLNVSESEGVPVSIMEALSAGIPVMATDVGGTHEIVSSDNGKLISPHINPLELAKEIDTFYNLPLSEKIKLREAAFRVYEEKSSAEKLYNDLAYFLLEDYTTENEK